MIPIALTPRQEKIAEIVRTRGPISGEQIADLVNVTRAALRPDLAILIMTGVLDARPKVGYFYVGKNSFAMLAAEIERLIVGDVHSVPIVIPPQASAYEAIITMFLEDVGAVFVAEEGILQGIISRKDLLKAALGKNDLQNMPAKMFMTSVLKIVVTTPDEPLLAAAKKLIDNEIDCLPVVKSVTGNQKGYEVIGRLTKTSITRIFVELGEGKRR